MLQKDQWKKPEKDPESKSACDAYTAGVNAYIENLKESELPLEYKLLDYKPEKWDNLKIALFLKYMSLDLAGPENDMEYTNAKTVFDASDFDKLYPITQDSLDPIVPKGTVFPEPSVKVVAPANADSIFSTWKNSTAINEIKPDKDNGSNNWAVAGTKTQSGAPILCNDPHLSLKYAFIMVRNAVAYSQFQFLWCIISRVRHVLLLALMIAAHGVLQMR